MDSEPRAEGALEACAREILAGLHHRRRHEDEVQDAVAIMRRHGLRGPDPRPRMTRSQLEKAYDAAIVEQARTPEESHEH